MNEDCKTNSNNYEFYTQKDWDDLTLELLSYSIGNKLTKEAKETVNVLKSNLEVAEMYFKALAKTFNSGTISLKTVKDVVTLINSKPEIALYFRQEIHKLVKKND